MGDSFWDYVTFWVAAAVVLAAVVWFLG